MGNCCCTQDSLQVHNLLSSISIEQHHPEARNEGLFKEINENPPDYPKVQFEESEDNYEEVVLQRAPNMFEFIHYQQVDSEELDGGEDSQAAINLHKDDQEQVFQKIKENHQWRNIEKANLICESLTGTSVLGEKVTQALSEIEIVLQILSKSSFYPQFLRNFKADLIQLYQALQEFRAYRLRYFISSDSIDFLTISQVSRLFLKTYQEQVQEGQMTKHLEFAKALVESDSDIDNSSTEVVVGFDVLHENMKKIIHFFESDSTANSYQKASYFSTIPNYIHITLDQQPGYKIWKQLFPNDIEVSRTAFEQEYAQSCSVNLQEIEKIMILLDSEQEMRIDVFKWVDFVKNNTTIFNTNDQIIVDQISSISLQITEATNRANMKPYDLNDGTFTLPSGAVFQGYLDDDYFKQGLGKIKFEDYEFQGTFVNNLPEGLGIEVRKNVEYKGYFEKGLYHGEGTLKYPNGRVYTGSFYHHQFQGIGELLSEDGIYYSGEWRLGALEFGQIKYHDGSVYTGKIHKNFLKHGQGSFKVVKCDLEKRDFNINSNNNAAVEARRKELVLLIEGTWKNDAPLFGKAYTYMETVLYDGTFTNWMLTGTGKWNYLDGYYEGGLLKMMKNGAGTMKYRNGDTFVGEWLLDVQKSGVYSFGKKKSNTYEGEWVDGAMQGQGKINYEGEGTYEGQVKDGERHGYGKYTYRNGDVYTGEWKNNCQDGEGVFEFSGGDIYNGQFVKGRFHGFGHYLYAKTERQYIGFWDNDMWHGEGKFVDRNNKIIKAGFWKEDKIVVPAMGKAIVIPKHLQHLIYKQREELLQMQYQSESDRASSGLFE